MGVERRREMRQGRQKWKRKLREVQAVFEVCVFIYSIYLYISTWGVKSGGVGERERERERRRREGEREREREREMRKKKKNGDESEIWRENHQTSLYLYYYSSMPK